MDIDADTRETNLNDSSFVASTENNESSDTRPKKRKAKQNELESLTSSVSASERSRSGRSKQPTLAALTPRTKPHAGALVDQGIIAPHRRLNARGLCNWREYGNIPPARTCEIVDNDGNIRIQKVFEWRGLFTEINKQKMFVVGDNGSETLRLTEAQIDFWDRVRIKWLAKRYKRHCDHYLIEPGIDWAPPASLVRTWHTSE